MRTLLLACAAFAMIPLAAEAKAPPAAPDYTPPPGSPATPHAKLYADCIAQAAAGPAYELSRDKDTQLIRFSCSGAPAKAFYEALGPWSATQKSEWTSAGRTWRSTGKIQKDLFGVDYCSTDGADDYRCAVTLNVGPFLTEGG